MSSSFQNVEIGDFGPGSVKLGGILVLSSVLNQTGGSGPIVQDDWAVVDLLNHSRLTMEECVGRPLYHYS